MAIRTRVAVIGDPHIAVPRGEDDTRLECDPGRKLHGLSVELLTRTIEEVNAYPGIAAALVLGDITRDSERFNHEVARELLALLRMPYYIVLGNHDCRHERAPGATYPGEERLDRDEVAQWYAGAGLPGGMTRYVADLGGDVMLVVLDSARTLAELAQEGGSLAQQDSGRAGEQQIAWLDGTLAQIVKAGRIPLVALHHALLDQSPAEHPKHLLYSAFRNWRVLDAAPLEAVLRRHNVRLVLSGHLHAQSVNAANGLCNLVTSATVSYPHAWRVLEFTESTIEIESHPLESIPSCPALQVQSRRWMAEGMEVLIRGRVSGMALLAGMATELCSFVTASGWWPRFCDGTQAGFSVPEGLMPKTSPVQGVLYGQVAGLLNEYGAWKAARPDPRSLSIKL